MLRTLSICVILLFSALPICVAQAPVKVNRTIKVIGGEPFYIHTVEQGQTLSAIAAAYYSDINSIKQANPGCAETPAEATKLKIPYSDASGDALSKPQTIQVYAASTSYAKAESEMPEIAPQPKNEENQVPITEPTSIEPLEEAAQLLEMEANQQAAPAPVIAETTSVAAIEEPTPVSAAETQALLGDLSLLSESINQSMANLAKMKETLLVNPDQVQRDQQLLADTTKGELLSKFIEQSSMTFFQENSAASNYYIKEYFFTRILSNGLIAGVEDGRTTMNKNTYLIDMDQLIGKRIDGREKLAAEPSKIALSIDARTDRHTYEVKVKSKKVRVYRTPFFVEYFAPDDTHGQAILNEAKRLDKKGKATVELRDGYQRISLMEPFEFNPFGQEKTPLFEQNFTTVSSLTFK